MPALCRAVAHSCCFLRVFRGVAAGVDIAIGPAMKKTWIGAFVLGAVIACGGSVATVDGEPAPSTSSSSGNSRSSSSGSGTSGGSSGTTSGNTETTLREPKVHRASPTACTPGRFDSPSTAPDGGVDPNGYIQCTSHAECNKGKNGRCSGNGHDGWRCTYDFCDGDIDCGGGTNVCECEGGFRSDNNVCLSQNGCATDRDCGPAGYGWCSPTLGACGHYSKTESYQCHTPADECVDDSDCTENGTGPFGGPGYCAYDSTVGHWKCSTSECAG